jgi:arylsulfatase A-like enzyme
MRHKPNFMIVITDQQSGNPYWPKGWEEENLPAMRWLRDHGMSFNRKLIHVMETLGTLPHDVVWPEHWGGQR